MQLRPKLPRLAICRGSDNPLAKVTGAVIATNSGADNGASSTGYTGMLLAIGLLADRILRRGALGGLGAAARRRRRDPCLHRRPRQTGGARCSRGAPPSISSGPVRVSRPRARLRCSSARRSGCRQPAGIPSNYLHGPMESQDAKTGLMAFGTGREVQIARDVAAFGCPSVLDHQPHRRSPRGQAGGDLPCPASAMRSPMPSSRSPPRSSSSPRCRMPQVLTNITFRYRQTDTKLKPWSPTEVSATPSRMLPRAAGRRRDGRFRRGSERGRNRPPAAWPQGRCHSSPAS